MRYKNIAGSFGLVTKYARDGRTDTITTPKTALAQLRRAVKTVGWTIDSGVAVGHEERREMSGEGGWSVTRALTLPQKKKSF